MSKEKKITKAELKKLETQIKKSGKSNTELKQQDLIAWLFDGNFDIVIPLHFLKSDSKLKTIITYIIPKFRTLPRVMNFFNEHLNKLYSRRSGEETLLFLKSYIQQHKIQRSWIDNTFYKQSDREKYLKWYLEAKGVLDGGDTGNILSEYEMINTGVYNNNPMAIKLWQEVFNEQNSGGDTSNNEELEALILEMENKKRDEDPRFIKELSNEIIEKYDLSLIDIKLLERINKILLIFIDKDNSKKYFIEDFVFEFVLSNINSIKYNDYIVNFDPQYHSIMICTDYNLVNKLRMSINKSRDKFFQQYCWIKK